MTNVKSSRRNLKNGRHTLVVNSRVVAVAVTVTRHVAEAASVPATVAVMLLSVVVGATSHREDAEATSLEEEVVMNQEAAVEEASHHVGEEGLSHVVVVGSSHVVGEGSSHVVREALSHVVGERLSHVVEVVLAVEEASHHAAAALNRVVVAVLVAVVAAMALVTAVAPVSLRANPSQGVVEAAVDSEDVVSSLH